MRQSRKGYIGVDDCCDNVNLPSSGNNLRDEGEVLRKSLRIRRCLTGTLISYLNGMNSYLNEMHSYPSEMNSYLEREDEPVTSASEGEVTQDTIWNGDSE